MGCCCGGGRSTRLQNIKLANKIFSNIDVKGEGQLNHENLTNYFQQYTESSVKIIMQEADLNQDGKITRTEWLAFWQYLRQAGIQEKSIKNSLKMLDKGISHLGFTRASSYRTEQPRQTLIKGIQLKMSQDPAFAKIMSQPPS